MAWLGVALVHSAAAASGNFDGLLVRLRSRAVIRNGDLAGDLAGFVGKDKLTTAGVRQRGETGIEGRSVVRDPIAYPAIPKRKADAIHHSHIPKIRYAAKTSGASHAQIAVDAEIPRRCRAAGRIERSKVRRRVIIEVESSAAERDLRVTQNLLAGAGVFRGHAIVDAGGRGVLRIPDRESPPPPVGHGAPEPPLRSLVSTPPLQHY